MQYFFEGSVICNLESGEKYAAIHELLLKAPVFRQIANISAVEDVIVEREKKLSTGLGHGVAFAHGKTDNVDSTFVALGISKKGIDYDALDKKPVYLLFIVVNPANGHQAYLKLISSLSRVLRDNGFREHILQMKNAGNIETEFRQALEKVEINC